LKVGGMFQSEWDCDRAPRECFPRVPLWLSTGLVFSIWIIRIN